MEYLLILVGVVIDRMFDLGFNKIKSWAEKSLLANLAVGKCSETTPYDGVIYWSALLRISKGNMLARILCRNGTNLKLVASVRFQSFEKDNFRADAYEVNRGWGKRRVAFTIKPNAEIKLAVARRIKSKEGYYLYPIGGSFGNVPLIGTYDLVVNLEIEGEDKPIEFPHNNRIKNYIEGSNPSEV